MQNYIICFSNRCGSTLLRELLCMDGQLGKAGESFRYKFVINLCEKHSLKEFQNFVVWLIKQTVSAQNIFGTKLDWSQLYFLTRIGIIPQIIKSPHFIHIYRKDVVGQAISLSIANQTEQWTSLQSAKIGLSEAAFKPKQILKSIEKINMSNQYLMDYLNYYGLNHASVAYEDLVNDQIGVVKKIINTLGIRLKKEIDINPDNLMLKRQSRELNDKFRNELLRQYPSLRSS